MKKQTAKRYSIAIVSVMLSIVLFLGGCNNSGNGDSPLNTTTAITITISEEHTLVLEETTTTPEKTTIANEETTKVTKTSNTNNPTKNSSTAPTREVEVATVYHPPLPEPDPTYNNSTTHPVPTTTQPEPTTKKPIVVEIPEQIPGTTGIANDVPVHEAKVFVITGGTDILAAA